MSNQFEFSMGEDKYDNSPKQFSVNDFDSFKSIVLANRSQIKGKKYFSSAFNYGHHYDLGRFPNPNHYRIKILAKPIQALSLDFDGFKDVPTYERIKLGLKIHKGFGYETWSSTSEYPRYRGVLELNRPVDGTEILAVGLAYKNYLLAQFGDDSIKLDESIFTLEHMVYGPPDYAQIDHFNGEIVNVDTLIGTWVERNVESKGSKLVNATEYAYAKLTPQSLIQVLSKIDFSEEPIWSDVANILARVHGEDGRDVFIKFSEGYYAGQSYSKFEIDEVNGRFDRALRESKNKNGYGIKKLCELANIQLSEVDFEKSLGNLVFPEVNALNKPKQVTANLESLARFKQISIRYNQIKKKSEIDIPNFKCTKDEIDNASLIYLTDEAIKAGLTSARIDEMTLRIAAEHPYCPVKEYIERASWDGIDRFEQFCAQIKTPNPEMSKLLLRKWLIQAVAAIYEGNGINGAGVIVITGNQGIGKTRLFKDLTSDIPDLFLEGAMLIPADKDSVATATSHWIVELGELDSTFKKAEISQLKAFFTKNVDTYRKPYAKKDSIHRRRTVFSGTVNDYEFLHDTTGNRRFWPIEAESIDRDTSINYQQLWAQIKSLYDKHETWHLSFKEQNQLEIYTEQFLVNDILIEKILKYYDFTNIQKLVPKTMDDICRDVNLDKVTKGDTQRIAAVIRKYNGNHKSKASNGFKYHYVPEKTPAFENTLENKFNLNKFIDSFAKSESSDTSDT
jgi:predicted P-loop ATPase